MKTNRTCLPRREFLERMLGAGSVVMAGTACVHAAQADNQSQRYEISLHQFSLKKLIDDGSLDPLHYPRFVKEKLGIVNVEYAADFYEPFMALRDAEQLRQQAEEFGVTNRAVLCTDVHALDASDTSERQAAIDYFARWGSIAASLGCEFLRVRAVSPGDRAKQLEYATAGISGLCDKLQETNVSVLVENIAEWSRDPDWLNTLVEKVGSERLGLIADFGNFDGDIYQGMQQLLPYTKSVCTKSWEFDAQGNETQIDFKKMMGIINASKFRGCIAIEYLGDEPLDGIGKTSALVKRHWAA